MKKPHALVVDDDHRSLESLATLVRTKGFRVTTATNVAAGRRVMADDPPDLTLVDLSLPDGRGTELFYGDDHRTEGRWVLVSGQATTDIAVEAMRYGASDFLSKPVDVERLFAILDRVRSSLEAVAKGSDEDLDGGDDPGLGQRLVGESPAMRKVFRDVRTVAPTNAAVVIYGETGTGKELIAQAIHEHSERAEGPFVVVNAGAISESLIESELFGHEKGSFTGANRAHRGVFERANGGTLFLDEIGELSPDSQVKLLRVLESGSFHRVGGERMIDVDVRIVAATHRLLAREVEEGRFRQDLFYRLEVVPIYLPTLRDRGDDVVLLAKRFLAMLNRRHGTDKKFTEATLAEIRTRAWPGNVREVRNFVHRCYVLSGELLDASHAPARIPIATKDNKGRVVVDVGTSIAVAERLLIDATLERFRGDKKRTAEVLGVSLKTLYNRLKAYRDADELNNGMADARV